MTRVPSPLISVIVAAYNGRTTLQQCIDSVVSQTHPERGLIIINGGSTDGTVDVLRENNEKTAYWVSEPVVASIALGTRGFTLRAFKPVFSDQASGRTLQVDGVFYRTT